MAIRVGINGFGRIGRLVYRIGAEQGIEFVAVNDLAADAGGILLDRYASDNPEDIHHGNVDWGLLVLDRLTRMTGLAASDPPDPAFLAARAAGAEFLPWNHA